MYIISSTTEEIYKKAKIFAKNNEPILIIGETGTGKEVVAKFIYNASDRKNKPFIPINCSCFPETLIESELFGYSKGAFTDAKSDKIGLIECADGGTLFLDEIGDLPLNLQSKLLRVIENKEILPIGTTKPRKVDFRLICATNKNLYKLQKENKFRDDLFHRISTLVIELPPLRERAEEIPLFVEKYLNEVRQGLYLAPEVMEIFLCFPWPGNIRQLRNAIIYAANITESNCIKITDLPPWLQEFAKNTQNTKENSLKERMKEYEKHIIDYYKKIYGNNYKELSRKLGISQTSLYRKSLN